MKTTSQTDNFSYQRFFQLSKRTVMLNRKNWLLGFLTVFGILTMAWFFPIFSGSAVWHNYQVINLASSAIIFYTIGGLFITSSIFDEIHSPSTAFLYLTLPATTLEKLTSAWFITSVLFTVVSLVSFFVFGLILQFYTQLTITSDTSFTLFNPFREKMVFTFLSYFCYNSVFLFGAIYFKKNNFLKVIVAAILLFVAVFFVVSISLFLFGQSFSLQLSIGNIGERTYYVINALIFFLFMLLAYIRLKNKQIV